MRFQPALSYALKSAMVRKGHKVKPSAPASESHSIICLGCEEGEFSSGGHRIGFSARCVATRRVVTSCREQPVKEMICVTVEIREGALTHRARVTAPSIECALKIVGVGKPGRRVRLVFPIDPEAFFVSAGSGTREAA